jgi:hypothetical protein
MSDVRRVACDICGRQEDSPQVGRTGAYLIRPANWKYVDSLDLCPECYADFQGWMKRCKRPSGAERD